MRISRSRSANCSRDSARLATSFSPSMTSIRGEDDGIDDSNQTVARRRESKHVEDADDTRNDVRVWQIRALVRGHCNGSRAVDDELDGHASLESRMQARTDIVTGL